MIFTNSKHEDLIVPCRVEGVGISLEAIKKGERSDDLIIRLVETTGSNSKAILKFKEYPVKISETNLIEWEEKEVSLISDNFEIRMKPFEIRTYRISFGE